MSQILTILRAAHCRSTHHYFALDALEHIETEKGHRLANLLLKHYDRYLVGAKDPDTKFRDFQNHVLHVGDNHWGGAPRTCEKWLKTAVNHLNAEEWEDAAYALGVLSHYFTDPVMPLHTASSEAEGVVHRAMEWSVCKSYEDIHDDWLDSDLEVKFELVDRPNWIGHAVTAGAEQSHKHYHRIIEIYDLQKGSKKPPEGLNAESREILAEMFAIAITGWARILERVADEAKVTIPEGSLTIPMLVAAIDMPVAWIVRKISSVSEQRAVKAIFQEYSQTGTVRQHLPPEIRTVRTEMALSVTDAKEFGAADAKRLDAHAAKSDQRSETSNTKTVEPAPAALPPSTRSAATASRPSDSARRASVSLESPLEDAPSIGPKTAKRFAKIGIDTIGQFLAADVYSLESQLDVRWITSDVLKDWQCHATFVCRVPSLCGYKSQLLVAVECRTPDQLASESAAELASRIATFCDTKAGERILRSATMPVESDVARWIADAKSPAEKRAA